MGQIVFIVLVIGGLGYFFYRQMNANRPKSDSSKLQEGKTAHATEGESNIQSQNNSDSIEPDPLNAQLVASVSRSPGILQTEIYTQFPEESRKNIQAALLEMDRDGVLRREREGSTYRLFVV